MYCLQGSRMHSGRTPRSSAVDAGEIRATPGGTNYRYTGNTNWSNMAGALVFMCYLHCCCCVTVTWCQTATVGHWFTLLIASCLVCTKYVHPYDPELPCHLFMIQLCLCRTLPMSYSCYVRHWTLLLMHNKLLVCNLLVCLSLCQLKAVTVTLSTGAAWREI